MPKAIVEITQSGRGGSIYYREGRNAITFDWEFAPSPALALIFGPSSKGWDEHFPWAAGRQAEIFDFVGQEVLRQKADGCEFEVDLDTGDMTILQSGLLPKGTSTKSRKRTTAKTPKASPAYKKFLASVVPVWEHWRDDQTYDLTAIKKLTGRERDQAVKLLIGRDVTWREVLALGEINTPEAQAALKAATEHHFSIDTRVAAADLLERQGRFSGLDDFLARQIRLLDRPANGLERALLAAERHPSEAVKQALLWASYNQTECASHCARLLLKLAGKASQAAGADAELMLTKLGMNNSYFDRKAAFEELCKRVCMELDHQAGY
jgi:hypothetical protein